MWFRIFMFWVGFNMFCCLMLKSVWVCFIWFFPLVNLFKMDYQITLRFFSGDKNFRFLWIFAELNGKGMSCCRRQSVNWWLVSVKIRGFTLTQAGLLQMVYHDNRCGVKFGWLLNGNSVFQYFSTSVLVFSFT